MLDWEPLSKLKDGNWAMDEVVREIQPELHQKSGRVFSCLKVMCYKDQKGPRAVSYVKVGVLNVSP